MRTLRLGVHHLLLDRSIFRLTRLWKKAVEPPAAIRDPGIRGRMRLVNGMLLMIIPVALLTLVIQVIFYPFADVVASTTAKAIILGVAVALLIYVLNRVIASFRLMTFVMMGVGFVAILVVAVTSSPPHFEFAFLLFLPLVGTILLSLREVLVISVLVFICLVVVGGSLPTMSREVLEDLIVYLTLAQAFVLFAAQQRTRMERDHQQLVLAETRSQLLSELITNLSHDFRTPLAIINTSAYLLGHSPDPRTRQETMELIDQQTIRLSGILDRILTISRLEHSVEASLEYLDLRRVLYTVTERFHPVADQKGLRLLVDLAESKQPTLASQEYMHQAFNHILENAMQFTPSGGSILVRSQVEAGVVQIEITDTGIGIRPADLPLIFDPFFRGDSTRPTDTGGAGLGLCIAKRIIEMHGGTIDAKSVVGRGTTIRVTIPLGLQARLDHS